MRLNGPAFYDDAQNFATYTAHRHQPDNPPNTLEKPVFLELVGAVSGRRILDLGCGAAHFGHEALEQGAELLSPTNSYPRLAPRVS
jgi:hypothetical protein